jgi:hypothetical protein
VILRCTVRAAGLLVGPRAAHARLPASDEDWYANVIWIDRRKCLLLMHAQTLFPVFVSDVRTAQWRPPGRPVIAAIQSALSHERLATDTLGVLDPDAVTTAATVSRRILGYMNETAHTCRYAVGHAGGLDLVHTDELNHQLRRLLHNRDGCHTPLDLIAQRRQAR